MTKLLLPVACLVGSGLLVLSSISLRLFSLQLAWAALGTLIVVLFLRLDWRSLLLQRSVVWGIYGLAVALLVITYLLGPTIRNTKSWFVIGPVSIQPVELLKVSLILVYAGYFSRRHLSVARVRHIVTSFLYFILPALVVAVQPNLGSAAVLFGVWFGFLIVAGLPLKRVLAACAIFLMLGFWGWQSVLRDYHRARIIGFLYPERNALGVNYSATQAKIAIGSAGWWGKGYGQGSQTQLGFLTVPSSDFVFAALVEEWGLGVGAAVVVVFMWILYCILAIGAGAAQNFEKFICLGTVMVLGAEFFLNVGSSLGLVPVVGLTLPFVSYGGSNLLTSAFLVGLVNAIGRRS